MRFHGGDREARLDFSSNTNPLGPPKMLYEVLRKCTEDANVIEKYPDYDYRALRKSISEFYHCNPSLVVASNGAAEAINLTVVALRPKRLVVLEPSYGEYEDLAKTLEAEYVSVYYDKSDTSFYLDLSKLKSFCEDSDTLIVVTNPNNPTGSYIPIESIVRELGSCKSRVMVDEAYVELCTNCPIELYSDIPKNFIIIRSLTKWLAIPGLRMGFLYTPDERILNRIDVIRQPWNINGITECAITNILSYKQYLRNFIIESREYISTERTRVTNTLRSMRLRVFDSVTNFILADLGMDSDRVLTAIKRRGIAVRSCKSFKGLGPNYIRISIRKTRENDELIDILREEMSLG